MSTLNGHIVLLGGEGQESKVDTINEAIEDLDAATMGYLIKSVAGSSNITLTRAEALHAAFEFTGVLTGSISVLFPVGSGSARLIVVHNNTTGAFTLTIKTNQGGSTGPTVTQAKSIVLYHNGTHVRKAGAEVTP